MRILLTVCLLLSVHVWAQLDCTDVACLAMVPDCAEGSCITLAGCCESCCETECVECQVSPCENWSCMGHPEFTCREDYCGGCNRIWYDGNGARTECAMELEVTIISAKQVKNSNFFY